MALIIKTEPYPLSPIQQGMLFHWLLDRHSGNDIEQLSVLLGEPLDPARLGGAWHQADEAFSMLRTAFLWEGLATPLQQIQPTATIPYAYEDLRQHSTAHQQEHIRGYLRRDRYEGFDLATAPALRVVLFQLDDSQFRMIVSCHHILMDARSIDIVLASVFETYEGRSSLGAVADHAYRDYIEWLGAQDASRSRRFWASNLRGFSATTPLLFDHPVGASGEQFGEHEISLSEETSSRLRDLASREALPFNCLVCSAWALLLARNSGERDVVFGVTQSTRRDTIANAYKTIGLFLATVPLRVAVDPDMALREWLRLVREALASLRGHEHLPLVDVKQQTELPATAALFDSLVMFENEPIGMRLRSKGDRWSSRRVTLLEQHGLPLGLMAYSDETLSLKIDYDARRFDDTSIVRMLGHLGTILEAWAQSVDGCVWQVPSLTEAERETLLLEWNRTRMAYPRHRSLAALIEEQAQKGPQRIAITFDQRTVTYRELNERANRLAHELIHRGVGPDTLVGVCLDRTPDMLTALVAVVKAGGAYVPLDPGFPRDRLAYMAADAALTVLVATRPYDSFFDDPALPVVLMEGSWQANECSGNPQVSVQPEHLAYVLYTSGSTGMPKGVEVTRGGFLNLLWSMSRTPGMTAADAVVALTTFSFDIAGVELLMPLALGARIILADRETATNPEALGALIERTAPTIIQATPVTFRMLFESGWRGDGTIKAICGGEAIPPDLGNALARACGEAWNGYGPTETTIYSAFHRIRPGDRVIYIGRPPANTTVYVLDSHRCPVPPGVTGELYIGGDGVARGYRNRPEQTAKRFVPSPFAHGQTLYRTGDLARYASDGTIECLGRTDHQLKIRGFRIEPGEIENLLKRRPDVRQAVVIAREDQPGDKRLVCYLVGGPGTLEPAVLKSYLKASLPDYMVPAAFVQLSSLPTTPNGKIDRLALTAPSTDATAAASPARPPRTAVERRLTEIWQDTFQSVTVGRDDNFWDLGGHSMLAVRLMGRIANEFGKRLPLNALFTAPTVEQLARYIEHHESTDGRHTLTSQRASGARPAVFWIPGGAALGLFSHSELVERLGPDQPLYALGSAFPTTVDDIERVEERAAAYLKLVRSVQPHGPYHFIGFCAGGVVAFEMAQQLQRRGEYTALLGMINCPFPGYPTARRSALRFKAQRLRQHMRAAWTEDTSLLGYTHRKVVERRANRSAQRKITDALQRARRDGFLDSGEEGYRVVLDATVAVVNEYRPAHYPGPVALFISDDSSLRGVSPDLDPRLAWRGYAAANDVYRLPGEHDAVVAVPHVFELADAIDAALCKTREASVPPESGGSVRTPRRTHGSVFSVAAAVLGAYNLAIDNSVICDLCTM